MMQWGRAGEEVERDSWWTSMDLDLGHILDADRVEVLDVLCEIPPTWAQAALPANEVLDAIAPYHPGAAEAVTAWYAAGLLVARTRWGLNIYGPGPQHRLVGELERDYWDGNAGRTNQYTKPYVVVVDPERTFLNRKLDHLPLDPVAAAAV